MDFNNPIRQYRSNLQLKNKESSFLAVLFLL